MCRTRTRLLALGLGAAVGLSVAVFSGTEAVSAAPSTVVRSADAASGTFGEPALLTQTSTTLAPATGRLSGSERMRLIVVFVLLLILAAGYSHLNDIPERKPRSLVSFGHHDKAEPNPAEET